MLNSLQRVGKPNVCCRNDIRFSMCTRNRISQWKLKVYLEMKSVGRISMCTREMISVGGNLICTRNGTSQWNFKVYYRNGVRSTLQTFKRVPSQRWGWRVNSFTGLTPKICFISLFLAKSIGVWSEIQKHNNIVLNKLYRIKPNLYIIECGNKTKFNIFL